MNETARERIMQYIEKKGFSRLFLYRPEDLAWLTAGGNSTVVVGETIAWVEVRNNEICVHTSRVEASRLHDEERVEVKIVEHPWHYSVPIQRPNDLEEDLTPLRFVLSQGEQERFRGLGRDTAVALGNAMRAARPEWTERSLAGHIAASLYERGIQPLVLLAAGEERIFKYRHPLPKDKPLGRIAMGVVCGCRDGLVANLTRIRVWNNREVHTLHEKVLKIEAVALNGSVPGAELGEIVEEIRKGYEDCGVPQAFDEHHQGGIAGYRPREVLAVPGDTTRLEIGMCLAWNPSLPGAKSEDTFLLTRHGLENLTTDPNWPMVSVDGRLRPAIFAG